MKYKQVNIRVTEEEYNTFQKAKLMMTIISEEYYTLTSTLVTLVNGFVESNTPIELLMETNQETKLPQPTKTIQETKPDIAKEESPITTAFNDIEI